MHPRHIYSVLLISNLISEILVVQGRFPNEVKRAIRTTHSKMPSEKNSEEKHIVSSTDTDQEINIYSSVSLSPSLSPTNSPVPTEFDASIKPFPPEQTDKEPNDVILEVVPDNTDYESGDSEAQGDLSLWAIAAGLFGIFVAGYVATKRIDGSRAKVPIDDDKSVDYDQSVREEGYQDIEES